MPAKSIGYKRGETRKLLILHGSVKMLQKSPLSELMVSYEDSILLSSQDVV